MTTADEPRTPTLDQTRRHLLELPELCALLPDAAHARSAIDGPRPAPASKPPLKLHVLHLLDEREKWNWEWGMWQVDPDRQGVLPYLHGWVRDIEASLYEESPRLPDEAPDEPTVANCCDWLSRHLGAAETLAQWPELAHGIKTLHGNVRAAVAGIRDRHRPVPCSQCGNPLSRDGDTNRWVCEACGHLVSVQAVTLRQAAHIVGRSERTLRSWAQRNLFTRISDGPRTNLYDLGDIRRVVAEVALRDGVV